MWGNSSQQKRGNFSQFAPIPAYRSRRLQLSFNVCCSCKSNVVEIEFTLLQKLFFMILRLPFERELNYCFNGCNFQLRILIFHKEKRSN